MFNGFLFGFLIKEKRLPLFFFGEFLLVDTLRVGGGSNGLTERLTVTNIGLLEGE